jgi:hypothetical protein
MAYKNDSIQTIMARYGKASDAIETEMYETWDAIRHMAVGGNALGGSGMGAFSSFLMNIGRMFGSPAFSPILGSQAISIPGTNYYAPISGGTGIVPGGQASFGLAPPGEQPLSSRAGRHFRHWGWATKARRLAALAIIIFPLKGSLVARRPRFQQETQRRRPFRERLLYSRNLWQAARWLVGPIVLAVSARRVRWWPRARVLLRAWDWAATGSCPPLPRFPELVACSPR